MRFYLLPFYSIHVNLHNSIQNREKRSPPFILTPSPIPFILLNFQNSPNTHPSRVLIKNPQLFKTEDYQKKSIKNSLNTLSGSYFDHHFINYQKQLHKL